MIPCFLPNSDRSKHVHVERPHGSASLAECKAFFRLPSSVFHVVPGMSLYGDLPPPAEGSQDADAPYVAKPAKQAPTPAAEKATEKTSARTDAPRPTVKSQPTGSPCIRVWCLDDFIERF